MNRSDILAHIRDVMSSLFELEPERVTLASTLGDDLDLDSIDAIDLIIKMQELSGEKIDPEAMRNVRTVGDIVDIVDGIVKRKGESG